MHLLHGIHTLAGFDTPEWYRFVWILGDQHMPDLLVHPHRRPRLSIRHGGVWNFDACAWLGHLTAVASVRVCSTCCDFCMAFALHGDRFGMFLLEDA